MPFRVFQFPIPTDPELPELNAFLAGQRVVTVERHVIVTPAGPMVVFIVETAGKARVSQFDPSGQKVDYREKLNADDRDVFEKLRARRAELSDAEGVPVYAIFSNAHLGAMSEERTASIESMLKISGISKSRVEKYGPHFLEILLKNQRPSSEPKA